MNPVATAPGSVFVWRTLMTRLRALVIRSPFRERTPDSKDERNRKPGSGFPFSLLLLPVSPPVRLPATMNQPSRIRRMLNARYSKQTSPAYLFDDMLRRHHRALLPARQLRNLIADDKETAIGGQQA